MVCSNIRPGGIYNDTGHQCGFKATGTDDQNTLEKAAAACATAGHVLLVATLLARGADVDARDADGRSAVWWACHSGQDQTAALLLDCKVTASGAEE